MRQSRYPYRGADPPAPYVLLNVFHPTDADAVLDVPALADTGADISVIPVAVIASVRAKRLGTIPIRGFDNRPDSLTVYLVRLQVRDLPVIELEVVGSDSVSTAIIGRDVLNRYDIRLDGPNRVMLISDA